VRERERERERERGTLANSKKGRIGFQNPHDFAFLFSKFKVVMILWIGVVIIELMECNGDELFWWDTLVWLRMEEKCKIKG